MCGIAGKIVFANTAISQSEIKQMVAKILHRGPDDHGTYLSQNRRVALGNTRLAIQDLSKKGHQPMGYMDRYVITYNGEVYNFLEEREHLRHLGYRFKSDSDTEVILALYDHYGIKCLDRLRGMFAFAIYDARKQTLFLARDRLGKKPLKYFFKNNVLIFASELKAILTQKEVGREVDWIAVNDFLTYGFVPSPKTGFRDIFKLPPAYYLFVDIKAKQVTKKRYWQPDYSTKLDLSEKEWCQTIISTLEEATRLRMISDVPVGAFLSGGVDSSAVVATMASLSPRPIKTFTIAFKEKGLNEAQHARRVAKKYTTDHTELTAHPENASRLLPFLAYQYEEPFADGSSVVTYMVSKLAKKHVTVILNGDGGDENFAGYDRIHRFHRDVFLDPLLTLIRPVALPIASLISTRGKRFLEKSRMPLAHRYATYNHYLSLSDKEWLIVGAKKKFFSHNAYRNTERTFKQAKVTDKRELALYSDMVMYLPDDLLAKVDIASMAVGLEARSPLLDHKFVELAASIPFDLKVKNGETKYIFKKALEGMVPLANLYRPKFGFSIPFKEWFGGSLSHYASRKLLNKGAAIREFLDTDGVKNMLSSHSSNNDFGPRLWAILTLEEWLEAFF